MGTARAGAPLAAIHDKVDRLVQRCGLEPERRAYLPHVTLARWSGGAIDARGWIERWAGLASPSVTLDRMVLYESTLRADGPVHEERLVVPLTRRNESA